MRRPSKQRRRVLSVSPPELLLCYALAKAKLGHRLMTMVVDTGASTSTLPHKIAVLLGIDPSQAKEHATIITASGIAYAPVVEIPVFSALGVELKGFKMACHDLPPESRVEGLLGVDFLCHFPPFQFFQTEVAKIAPQFWKS